MKNIKNLILMTLLILLFSLLIVKQDIVYYNEKNNTYTDMKDKYFLFNITKSDIGCNKGQCGELRGYPFSMTKEIPILHQGSVILGKNVLYNFLLYLGLMILGLGSYNKFLKKIKGKID